MADDEAANILGDNVAEAVCYDQFTDQSISKYAKRPCLKRLCRKYGYTDYVHMKMSWWPLTQFVSGTL